VNATKCPGMTFELTAIAPAPPAATIGRVITSSPDQTAKPGSAPAMISITCWSEPLASLTPTTFSMCDRRTMVSGRMFDAVRAGML